MALAPFKPPGAKSQRGVRTHDGGTAWPLEDGGWAFQYPDMALRMEQDGSTRIVWSKPAYSVEYDESGNQIGLDTPSPLRAGIEDRAKPSGSCAKPA